MTRLTDLPDLRDRVRVFRDGGHAGRLLSEILGEYRHSDALVMAIPAGGVPVAVAVGKCLKLPVDVVVVSKITFPWNTETGYGALAFDGTLRLNDALLTHRLSRARTKGPPACAASRRSMLSAHIEGDRSPNREWA